MAFSRKSSNRNMFGAKSSGGAGAAPIKIRKTEDGIPVRTIYVSSLPRNTHRDQMVAHFSAFGELENVRVCVRPTFVFGFVTYKRAEDASRALAQRTQRMSNKVINVNAADSWHQSDQNQIDNKNGKSAKQVQQDEFNPDAPSLLDLNDDCLIAVCRELPIFDLSAVADTCTRLQGIANTVFHVSPYTDFSLVPFTDTKVTLLQVRNLLKNFGSMITTFTLHSDLLPKNMKPVRVLNFIIQYCTGTLESLQLESFQMDGLTADRIRPLLRQLKKLTMQMCVMNIPSNINLLAGCNQLVKLKLWKNENFEAEELTNSFPQLESFTFSDDLLDDLSELEEFIQNHENLKKLSLGDCDESYSTLLPTIASNLKQLEKLYIRDELFPDYTATDTITHLTKLEHLKKFKLYCGGVVISKWLPSMASLESIEYLELVEGCMDGDCVDALIKMKSLRQLHLLKMIGFSEAHLKELGRLNQLSKLFLMGSCGLTTVILVDLVAKLNKLKELTILSTGVLVFSTAIIEIANICRKRTEKCKLVIMSYEDGQPDTPELLQIEHGDYLEIRREDKYKHLLYDGSTDYEDSDVDEDMFFDYDDFDYDEIDSDADYYDSDNDFGLALFGIANFHNMYDDF